MRGATCRWNWPTPSPRRKGRTRTTSGRSISARSTRPRTPRCASILTLDGETVVKAVPDIGYLHSGFEKLGEHLDYNQYVTIVDRMNYISPVANEVAWHHAVEKLMGIELTPRCKYIRTIFAELMRIHDHLLCMRRGGPRPRRLHGLPVRLQPAGKDLRHLRDGVRPALPPQLHPRRRPAARPRRRLRSPRSAPSSRSSPRRTPTWCRLLNRNRIFIDRTQGHRRSLARRTRSTSAAPGPIARASGVVRDLRKDEPYLAYKDLDFKVVCSDGGDCLARYLVRMEEMLESSRSSSRRSRTCRPGRSTSTSTARWSCPTRCRSIAASRG